VKLVALAVTLGSSGCLGPQVGDELAPSGDIVPAGTTIPPIDGNDAITIAMNDNVDGVVPRLTAFAGGVQIHTWDFGPAPSFAAPVYMLVRDPGDGTRQVIDHPPIIGTIPGEAGYSPFWSVFEVEVTSAYAGELLTSSTSLEEAERDGLIEAPKPFGMAVNYPIVAADVRLDNGSATQLAPAHSFYYERHTVAYFDFGALAITSSVEIASSPRYVLRREGEEPLSEPMRGVDMDGDGDTLDSNDILEAAGSPLCQRVDVVVARATASIDTSRDDAIADLTSAPQLFAPGPVAGTVIAVSPTTELRDCPRQGGS
jgi:hypothetical protein